MCLCVCDLYICNFLTAPFVRFMVHLNFKSFFGGHGDDDGVGPFLKWPAIVAESGRVWPR